MARLSLLALLFWVPLVLAGADARLEQARDAVLKRDPQQALRIWNELAAAGEPEAQYQLGVQYAAGRWLPRNMAAAARWYQAAAERGHARAQYNLAELYAQGEGVTQNLAQARSWYTQAAAQGVDAAARRLTALETPAAAAGDELFAAVRRGAAPELKELLSRASSADLRDAQGRTPLMYAAERGDEDCLQVLLNARADARAVDGQGNSALLLAVRAGQAGTAQGLLRAGAPVDQADIQGNTALLLAVRRGDAAMTDVLLRNRADPNHANGDGLQPLRLALDAGAQNLAVLLRRAGAREPQQEALASAIERVDPARAMSAAGEGGAQWPPLHLAAWRGQARMVQTLLERGAPVDATDAEGHSALTRAALRGHADVIQMLLRRGAAIEHHSADGRTALLHAAGAGAAPAIDALLAAGARANARDAAGHTALRLAVDGRHEEAALRLARAAPSLVPATPDALIEASAANLGRLAALMLKSGRFDQATLDKALAHAVRRGDAALAGKLMQRGASARLRDAEGSMLEIAIRQRHIGLVDLLIKAGADLRASPPPLTIAAGIGDAAIVGRLLIAGAEVDAGDALQNTALMRAAARGDVAVIKALLARGADTRRRNRDGDSAVTLARQGGHKDAEQLLTADKGSIFDFSP